MIRRAGTVSLRYLLDTNILSDLIRNPEGVIAKRIEAVGEDTVCTSIVVAAELRFGAAKRSSKRLTERVELVLGLLKVAPFEAGMDKMYAAVRVVLEANGTPIGGNDMLIAAQAKTMKLTLVTANEREFRRVPKLKVQNWLQTPNR
jgi:tRNA(fMet)-specific endonuclease VapC